MTAINSDTYEIVIVDDTVLVQGNQVVIRDKSTNEMALISVEAAENIFGLQVRVDIEEKNNSHSPSSLPWSKSNINFLISQYSKHEHEFKSTSIKNETVWKKIAAEIGCYTSKQCSDKFKYLKQKYMKKKDNMAACSSGAELFKFDYFEEMDSNFGKKPNVVPVATASSSRANECNEESVIEDDSSQEAPPTKKQKKIHVAKHGNSINSLLAQLKEKHEASERSRQLRHEERMKSYNDKMEALLNKL